MTRAGIRLLQAGYWTIFLLLPAAYLGLLLDENHSPLPLFLIALHIGFSLAAGLVLRKHIPAYYEMGILVKDATAEPAPLAEALSAIDSSIRCQMLRAPNTACAGYSLSGDPADWHVVPGLFSPLIEGAFANTGNMRNACVVTIRMEIEPQSICLVCRRTGTTKPLNRAVEVLMRSRLKLLYPGRHTLEIDQAKGICQFRMEIRRGPV